MLKKKSDIIGNVHENFKGGEGNVTSFHFMTEQEVLGAGRVFAKFSIQPGCSVGYHKHDGDSEVYYILKGKGLISDDGTDVVVEAGDAQFCPDGHCHSIKNIGEDTLEYIAIILYTKQKAV